jgi:hypothetical protein
MKNGRIITFTGGSFYPLEPRAEDINPIDIAHALSNQCRYTGHVRRFYSVAEHCCHIHDWLEKMIVGVRESFWSLRASCVVPFARCRRSIFV